MTCRTTMTLMLLATLANPVDADDPGRVCEYRVSALPGAALVLDVEGVCEALDTGSVRFINPASTAFAEFTPDSGNGRIRYHFRVDDYIDTRDNHRTATRRNEARMLILGDWLAVPMAAAGNTRIVINVNKTTNFASALPVQSDGRFYIDVEDLGRSGYTVFGAFEPRSIRLAAARGTDDAEIVVIDLRSGGDDLVPWIEDTATELARFWGGFPVPRLLLVLLETRGEGIEYGRVVAGGGATMLLVVGEAARREQLYGEWVLVHEMLHLGSPFMRDGFWFMEGFATYAEPIIRARAGWRSERSVWSEFHRDMSRAVPALVEHGLANARMGMYWGGALFMLLADREYRRSSGGERGLEHCMREALNTLGDATVETSVTRIIAFCDTYFGSAVMGDLAAHHVFAGSPIDIDALWRELGVQGSAFSTRLDDTTPDAAIRRAIVRRSADGEVPMNPAAPDFAQ